MPDQKQNSTIAADVNAGRQASEKYVSALASVILKKLTQTTTKPTASQGPNQNTSH